MEVLASFLALHLISKTPTLVCTHWYSWRNRPWIWKMPQGSYWVARPGLVGFRERQTQRHFLMPRGTGLQHWYFLPEQIYIKDPGTRQGSAGIDHGGKTSYFFDWPPIEQLGPSQVGTGLFCGLLVFLRSCCRPASTGAPQEGIPSLGNSHLLIQIHITKTRRRERRLSIKIWLP